VEGAGVHLRRAFPTGVGAGLDPFLLLDHFGGDDPSQYRAGFPWHPHRGIETITYLLDGSVEHGDSMGNSGTIYPGDVQWMTAGSGIIHQEMPAGSPTGTMEGFQLWANLPASHKMIDPRYQGITSSEIPSVEDNGASVRVICGTAGGVSGPARNIIIEPEYLDVNLPAGKRWVHPIPAGNTAFAYLFRGAACFDSERGEIASQGGMLIIFKDGDQVEVEAGAQDARFLLISGKPLKEPIAWGGPIVMNTQEELRTAFAEYRAGTFIKTGRK
jgi:redox-sensitive bicupin YhaK (pirin superfamily)